MAFFRLQVLLLLSALLVLHVAASTPSHLCKFTNINQGPFYYQGKQVSGDFSTNILLIPTDSSNMTFVATDANGDLMHKVLIKNDHITFKNGHNMDQSYVYLVQWDISPNGDPNGSGFPGPSAYEQSFVQLSKNHRCKMNIWQPPPAGAKIKQVNVETLH